MLAGFRGKLTRTHIEEENKAEKRRQQQAEVDARQRIKEEKQRVIRGEEKERMLREAKEGDRMVQQIRWYGERQQTLETMEIGTMVSWCSPMVGKGKTVTRAWMMLSPNFNEPQLYLLSPIVSKRNPKNGFANVRLSSIKQILYGRKGEVFGSYGETQPFDESLQLSLVYGEMPVEATIAFAVDDIKSAALWWTGLQHAVGDESVCNIGNTGTWQTLFLWKALNLKLQQEVESTSLLSVVKQITRAEMKWHGDTLGSRRTLSA